MRWRGAPTWTSPSSTHDNLFLFTPMLHEVAASDLDITNIVSPSRRLLRRMTFFHGEIEAIDLEQRRVGYRMGMKTIATHWRTTTLYWPLGPPRISSISPD